MSAPTTSSLSVSITVRSYWCKIWMLYLCLFTSTEVDVNNLICTTFTNTGVVCTTQVEQKFISCPKILWAMQCIIINVTKLHGTDQQKSAVQVLNVSNVHFTLQEPRLFLVIEAFLTPLS